MTGSVFDDAALHLSAQVLGPDVLVTMSGELDIQSAPAVAALYADVISDACRRVVIDASGLTFLDGAGVRAIHGGPPSVEVIVRAPSRPARLVLDLVAPGVITKRPVARPPADGTERVPARPSPGPDA
jgi:anti-anti-sigma factor